MSSTNARRMKASALSLPTVILLSMLAASRISHAAVNIPDSEVTWDLLSDRGKATLASQELELVYRDATTDHAFNWEVSIFIRRLLWLPQEQHKWMIAQAVSFSRAMEPKSRYLLLTQMGHKLKAEDSKWLQNLLFVQVSSVISSEYSPNTRVIPGTPAADFIAATGELHSNDASAVTPDKFLILILSILDGAPDVTLRYKLFERVQSALHLANPSASIANQLKEQNQGIYQLARVIGPVIGDDGHTPLDVNGRFRSLSLFLVQQAQLNDLQKQMERVKSDVRQIKSDVETLKDEVKILNGRVGHIEDLLLQNSVIELPLNDTIRKLLEDFAPSFVTDDVDGDEGGNNLRLPPLPIKWYLAHCELRWYRRRLPPRDHSADSCSNPQDVWDYNGKSQRGDWLPRNEKTDFREALNVAQMAYPNGPFWTRTFPGSIPPDVFFRLSFQPAHDWDYRNGRDRKWPRNWKVAEEKQDCVYGRAIRILDMTTHQAMTNRLVLQYFLFFGWNDVWADRNVLHCPLGNHEGDVTCVEIEIDRIPNAKGWTISRAIYHDHGRQFFVAADTVPKDNRQHPLVYLESLNHEAVPWKGEHGFVPNELPIGISTNTIYAGEEHWGYHLGGENDDVPVVRHHLGSGPTLCATKVKYIGPIPAGQKLYEDEIEESAFIRTYPGLYGDDADDQCDESDAVSGLVNAAVGYVTDGIAPLVELMPGIGQIQIDVIVAKHAISVNSPKGPPFQPKMWHRCYSQANKYVGSKK